MLGNFSIGDYFKQGAVEWAWELSRRASPSIPSDIWITVFGGDEELGLGADEEAIETWLGSACPRADRPCSRTENFWQAGPTGPCGPCSELYIDRGPAWGKDDEDLPGGENERFLEYWNLVFTQYDLRRTRTAASASTPLPANNIDTGLGLEPDGASSSRASTRSSRPTRSRR